MEIIVIDDGSEDKTLSVIKKSVSKTDIRAKIYCNEGKGVSMARQMAAKNASGKYIVWIDGDMTFSKDFVRKQVEFMEQNPRVGVAQGTLSYKKAPLLTTLENLNYLGSSSERRKMSNEELEFLGTGGSIFRIEAIRQVGGFDQRIKGAAEDADITARIKASGWLLSQTPYEWCHNYKGTWKEFSIKYYRHGYGAHCVSHKSKLFALWPDILPVSFWIGFRLSLEAYNITRRKVSFLLPFHAIWKHLAWWIGFAKSHKDGYGHDVRKFEKRESAHKNSSLNILFVVQGFNIMGGTVARTINLIKNLYRYKTDTSILTTYLSKDVYTTLIRSNLRKIYIRKNKSHEGIPAGLDVFAILSMIIDFSKYLKEHECDLIYARAHNPEGVLACSFISIFKRKPLVIELHHHFGTRERAFFRLYLRMIEKLVVIFSTKLLVNSWTFYRELISVHGENLSRKVYVVPNSIDFNLFHLYNDQPPTSTKSSKQVIGFVGSLKPDEDLFCLVKAAEIVLQTYQNAVFMVIGQDMGLKPELEKEIERLGLKGRFLLIDEKPSHEIPGILKTFSVFVAPRVSNERTRYAMPIKILEAMASGVPVVATSLPPIEELTNDTAILVPPSDPVSLAKGILMLLEDNNLRNEIIKKGLRRAENFDSEKIARYFAKILTANKKR